MISQEIIPLIVESGISTGVVQLFIQHTSASLTINENADPTVREDFESFFNRLVPENAPYFKHDYEGPDDMPAHLKASMMLSSGQSLIDGVDAILTTQEIELLSRAEHDSAVVNAITKQINARCALTLGLKE